MTRPPIASDAYLAAFHLLTTPLIATRTEPYMLSDRFDWQGLFDDLVPTLSPGESILVSAAHDLCDPWDNDYPRVELVDIAHRLDSENARRVVEAIQVRRGDHSCLI
jgi:hypothetical protein